MCVLTLSLGIYWCSVSFSTTVNTTAQFHVVLDAGHGGIDPGASKKGFNEKDINFKWHLVGDGILREELEHMVIDMGVEDCFKFEGTI